MFTKTNPLSQHTIPYHTFFFTMKPTDDIWKDITTLSSPTTNHFQNFFAPALRPPVTTTHFFPQPPSITTMLALHATTNLDHDQDPNKRHKPNPPPSQQQQKQQSCTPPATTSPEYSEKFRRLMKNRESASRSRARKQVLFLILYFKIVKIFLFIY